MRQAKSVLLEAALAAVLGLTFALVANGLSPRGLRLNRDYFPGGERSATASHGVAPPGADAGAASGSTNAAEATLLRLQQRGLQLITSNGVVELIHDPRYEEGTVLLIDARDDSHYQAGHIPGAWQFDHYHPDQFLPALLPACVNAQQVVVYCNGGACEDSEFAAIMLREAGVPKERLFVYAGGITEWSTGGWPVETGARQSGQMLKPRLSSPQAAGGGVKQ